MHNNISLTYIIYPSTSKIINIPNELYIANQVIHNNPSYTLHFKLYNAFNAKIHTFTSSYLYTQKKTYIHNMSSYKLIL